MLAELHARWEREDEMARKMKVCTITTSNDVVPNASNRLTLIGVEKSPTPCVKKPKTVKTFSTKSVEIFRSMGDDSSIYFNDFDVDGCNISKVILFLQKLALSPNASSMNVDFTNHITNALMIIREKKLKQKASIPKKLEDGWLWCVSNSPLGTPRGRYNEHISKSSLSCETKVYRTSRRKPNFRW
jgi:hypothetical protein